MMGLLDRMNTTKSDDLLTWRYVKKKQLPPKGVNVLCYGKVKMGSEGTQKREVKDYFVAHFSPWPDAPCRFKMRFTWFNAWIYEVEKWRFIEPYESDGEKHAA